VGLNKPGAGEVMLRTWTKETTRGLVNRASSQISWRISMGRERNWGKDGEGVDGGVGRSQDGGFGCIDSRWPVISPTEYFSFEDLGGKKMRESSDNAEIE